MRYPYQVTQVVAFDWRTGKETIVVHSRHLTERNAERAAVRYARQYVRGRRQDAGHETFWSPVLSPDAGLREAREYGYDVRAV